MRWYWVWCFRASPLKKSTLDLLSPMVTLTCSSRNARSEGGGSVSRTTLMSPMGPSVYVILLLIYPLAFPPVTCAEDTDDVPAVREAHGQNPISDPAEAEEALLLLAVSQVLGDHTIRISEGILGKLERNAMLPLVLPVLLGTPLERHLGHVNKVSDRTNCGNMIVWASVLLRQRVPLRLLNRARAVEQYKSRLLLASFCSGMKWSCVQLNTKGLDDL